MVSPDEFARDLNLKQFKRNDKPVLLMYNYAFIILPTIYKTMGAVSLDLVSLLQTLGPKRVEKYICV